MRGSARILIDKRLKKLSSRNIRYKYINNYAITCSIKNNGKTVKIYCYTYEYNSLLSIVHHCDKHMSDWLNYCNKIAEQINTTYLLYSAHIIFKSSREGYLSQFSVGKSIYTTHASLDSIYSPWHDSGLNNVCQCLLLNSDYAIDNNYLGNLDIKCDTPLYIPLKKHHSMNFSHINALNIGNKLYTAMRRNPIVDIILEKK